VRKGIFALVVIAVLIAGGFLTVQLITSGPGGTLPVRVQTQNPEGSTIAAPPNQTLAFVIFCLVGIASLIGGGAILGFVFYYLDRQIATTKKRTQS